MKFSYVITELCLTLFLVSCATVPKSTLMPEYPVESVEAGPTKGHETQPSTTPESAPDLPLSPAETFSISTETYTASLAQVRNLIERLNLLILQTNFEDWKVHLDAQYMDRFNDPVVLQAVMDSSNMLRENGVKLRNLADYFKFVVSPSRSNVTVDSIAYMDENRVEAFALIKGQKVLLYQLKLSGEEWMVSNW